MSITAACDYPATCRLDYTHFVSIPLATPEVQHQLRALKESVLADLSAAAAGIEESLFVDERKLHLTLVMLKLYSEERRQQAVRVRRTICVVSSTTALDQNQVN